MRGNKLLFIFVILFLLIFGTIQSAFADRFWDLYQLVEASKDQGDIIGTIDAWKEIVNLYEGDTSKDGLTRSAVYWGKIADAYNNMGWYGEAQQAYEKVEYFWNQLGETNSACGPDRIATRLKTVLEVYTKFPVEPKNNLAKFEPLSGIYFGAPFDKDPKVGDDITKVESVYGKKHTAFLMYVRWGEPIQEGTATQAQKLGAALQIAWEPPADMNEISYNEVVDFAKKLKELEIPVFLRFASEMNEASNPWNQNSPEVYKKVFRMVADIMHKQAPNVAMVWSPNYVPMDIIPSYYPGDNAVDWVGVNAYTDRYFIGDPNYDQLIQDLYYQGYYANPLDKFEYIYNTYSAKKPIMICETGIQNYAMNTREDFSSWAENNVRRLYSYIPMKYPRIKAIFYFNVDSNLVPALNLKQNYSLSRSIQVMNAYKEVIQNPYYLSNIGESVDYQYKLLEDVVVNNNTVELFSYVKLIDPFINKVEYWIDGQRVGVSTKIPFNYSVNLGILSAGEHILRVDAYNSKKELSARRIYTIIVEGENVRFVPDNVQYIPRHKVLRDINSHWAKEQIEKLVSLWSIDGYEDETFKPEKQITRAEFYKLLSTSLGMELKVGSNFLHDVPNSHWAKKLLEGGVQLGIIDITEYTEFNADLPITRGEMAVWTVRALNKGKNMLPQDTNFADDNMIPQKYKGYINEAYNMKIIDGFPDNTFRANDTATRAQAVSMIIRAVEYQQSR